MPPLHLLYQRATLPLLYALDHAAACLHTPCSGHGTFSEAGTLVANAAGLVERVNRLVSVRPVNSRYIGEVGDVVVGRIVEVSNQ